MLNAKTDQTLKGFRLPPLTCSLSQTAVQLSADIYLPKGELETQYPTAIIREAGCDRVMIWREEPRAETQSPAEGKSNHAFSSAPFAPLRETIWVVFMGTHNLPSLMSDLDVRRHSLGDGREVHAGFDNGVEELWPDILAGISEAGMPGGSTARLSSPKSELAEVPGVQSPDGFPIPNRDPYLIWTGHSRGASQAILAADRWERTVDSDQWLVTSG